VPEIVGGTTLDVRYGYSTPPPPATGSVWSSSYTAVWHLTDAGNPLDATTAHHDGMVLGPLPTAGLIAGGRSFVNASPPQAIRIPDAPDLTFAAMTISAWVDQRTPTAGNYAAFVTRQLAMGTSNDFYLGVRGSIAFAEIYTPTGPATGFEADAPGPAPIGQWFHMALTADGSLLSFFIDDAVVASKSYSGVLEHTAHPIYIGADCNTGGPCPDTDEIDAVLDEVRIENVARSPTWMAYDVASMRDQVITYGPIQH
jgi:biopolymer transport protein ExbB